MCITEAKRRFPEFIFFHKSSEFTFFLERNSLSSEFWSGENMNDREIGTPDLKLLPRLGDIPSGKKCFFHHSWGCDTEAGSLRWVVADATLS
jgi:hypothetical protein